MDWNNEGDVKRTQLVFEQYQAYIGDLGNIGTRHAAAQGFYFSLLGVTVAVLELSTKGLAGPAMHLPWIAAFFGETVCLLWLMALNRYRTLFAVKFKVLRELEQQLPVQPYNEETRLLDTPLPESKRRHWLIWSERFVPIVFAILFLALLLLNIPHR